MPSINAVTLLGRFGKDPEKKFTQGGQSVCNASIATEKSWKKDGEWKKSTTWHKIVAWGKLAEALAVGAKGDLVLIQGELTTRTWENREGAKQYVTEVLARLVVVIGEKRGQSTEDAEDGDLQPGADDDVPF